MSSLSLTRDGGAGIFELADMLEKVVLDFRSTLTSELADIQPRLDRDEATADERIKAFAGFYKMIQGIEMITNGIRQQRETDSGREIEVVEFRRQLEEQIARLVDQEAPGDVS